jgi:positive regulator of sigma E activity
MSTGYNGVCSDQETFNHAFHKALKHEEKSEMKKMRTSTIVYVILWFIFFIWAILLAFKSEPEHRLIHLVLAMVFSPFYVISYYLMMMQ